MGSKRYPSRPVRLQILLGSFLWALAPTRLSCQPPPLPASSPHGSRPPAQAWHPARPVKHPELDVSGSVGPRAASPASALCLDSARGHAEPPRLAAPPRLARLLLTPTWEQSPCRARARPQSAAPAAAGEACTRQPRSSAAKSNKINKQLSKTYIFQKEKSQVRRVALFETEEQDAEVDA